MLRPDGTTIGPGGFTLAELLVTLALVSVLAGLAVPSVENSLERAEARRVARQVANSFREARNQAMSRAQVVLAEVVTANQGQIVLYRTTNQATSCREANKNKATEVARTTVREISGDIGILGHATGQPEWLCFAPDGRVLNLDGNIVDGPLCEGANFRMWIGNKDLKVESIHKKCPSSKSERREQDRERTMANFWVVHVPFNGAVRASQ
ncbi:MAG: Tfp pilus assembly protein FimT/FimU [Bradymonadaceae bacterium]